MAWKINEKYVREMAGWDRENAQRKWRFGATKRDEAAVRVLEELFDSAGAGTHFHEHAGSNLRWLMKEDVLPQGLRWGYNPVTRAGWLRFDEDAYYSHGQSWICLWRQMMTRYGFPHHARYGGDRWWFHFPEKIREEIVETPVITAPAEVAEEVKVEEIAVEKPAFAPKVVRGMTRKNRPTIKVNEEELED